MDQYRKTPRAAFLDYDSGTYFITICTKGHRHYFGEISNGEMVLSTLGQFVDLQLQSASQFRQDVVVPLHVVMPNHVHAIVGIGGECVESGELQRAPNPSLRANFDDGRYAPVLSRYVNSLKGSVTKYAKTMGVEFEWQSRYHDHFIRNNRDGNQIAEYILYNVSKWSTDCYNLRRAKDR